MDQVNVTGEEPALSEKNSQKLNIRRILFSMQEGDVVLYFVSIFK